MRRCGANARVVVRSPIRCRSTQPAQLSTAHVPAANFPASTVWRSCCCGRKTPPLSVKASLPLGSPNGWLHANSAPRNDRCLRVLSQGRARCGACRQWWVVGQNRSGTAVVEHRKGVASYGHCGRSAVEFYEYPQYVSDMTLLPLRDLSVQATHPGLMAFP